MSGIIQPVKGTRDFYPEVMAIRSWLYATVAKVSRSFGYEEYEGPLLEPLELYAAKSGEELVKEQSFVFEDRGGNLVTLRPELTPTLARMIAQRQRQLVFPLRWWSFGPFWRYERPQKGRTREFFQWNIDLIGSSSIAADAELISVIISFFNKVGLQPDEVRVMVNNRQLIESELKSIEISHEMLSTVFKLIDKRDKLSPSDWEAYAIETGLTKSQTDGILRILQDKNLWMKSKTLTDLFALLESLGLASYVEFAPHIIRGLDYYTGTVFEAQSIAGRVKRSILGGGRYDNLLADVGGQPLPAVGFAMGDLVITLLLQELGKLPEKINTTPASALITIFDEDHISHSMALAQELRESCFDICLYPEAEKLDKQIKYADRKGIPLVIILGPDEIANHQVTIKHMLTRSQRSVSRDQVNTAIQMMLDSEIPS